MANETFRSKGAIEPDGSFSSSNDNMFRWKGAIEPAGDVGRIMSSLAAAGGLAAKGGIAGKGGGLAG